MGQYLDLLKQQHSRFKCMVCSMSPTIEILWAEGMAHAWFCDKHFKEFKNKKGGWHEIDAQRKIYGEASKKWSDGVPKKKDISKQVLGFSGFGNDMGAYNPDGDNAFSIENKKKYKSLEELQELTKQEGVGVGDYGGPATYMDSSNSNVFTPTFGGNSDKKYKSLKELEEDVLKKQHTIPETVLDRPKVARTTHAHRDVSKLVRRMVRVKNPDGTSYFSTRWVKPGTPGSFESKKKPEKDMFESIKDKEKRKKEGGVIVLIPPQNIKNLLYLEGGIEKEEMHITLVYLPFPWNTSVVEFMKKAELPPLSGQLTGKIERFSSDGEDAAVATLIIPSIDEWRENLIPQLKESGLIVEEKYPIFRAHITLKYIPKDSPLPIETVKPSEFQFDRLEVWEEERKTVIKDFSKDKDLEVQKIVNMVKGMDLKEKILWWRDFKKELVQKERNWLIEELVLKFRDV